MHSIKHMFKFSFLAATIAFASEHPAPSHAAPTKEHHTAAPAAVTHEATTPEMSPDYALTKLMDGNLHYLNNKLSGVSKSGTPDRTRLAKSQSPYAVVLTCSDSRVPPELIFDKGLGEIFVVRVAGNIPDPVVLGSIEYAVEHLGSQLIMVLGHERCGAVKATVESQGKSSGSPNIDAIVKIIAPNIKTASKNCKGDLVDCVIDENTKNIALELTKKSKILEHMVHTEKIKIVAAKYDLDEGTVTLFK